jgi:hypothetical protein
MVTVKSVSERCNESHMKLTSLAENCPRRIFIQTMWNVVLHDMMMNFGFYKK